MVEHSSYDVQVNDGKVKNILSEGISTDEVCRIYYNHFGHVLGALTFPISRSMMLDPDRPSCHRCKVHFNLRTWKDLYLCRRWRRSATN